MNRSFIVSADVNHNYGYKDIPYIWNGKASPSRRDSHDTYALFVHDVATLYKRNKNILTNLQGTNIIPPHEIIPFLTEEIMNETKRFAAQRKRRRKQEYSTDRSPVMSPMQAIVKQTVILRYFDNLKRLFANSDSPNTAQYPPFSFTLNCRQAVTDSFSRKNKLIPDEIALHSVSPYLGKGSYYKIQGNLTIASSLTDFNHITYKEMVKHYALDALRDISRIYQEYQIELDSGRPNRDAILSTLRQEATITDYKDDFDHFDKALHNFYVLEASKWPSAPTLDEDHIRFDYDDLRTRSYYDEFLFALYKTMDPHIDREDFTSRLRNGDIITEFCDNFQSIQGNRQFTNLEKLAQKEMDSYVDRLGEQPPKHSRFPVPSNI